MRKIKNKTQIWIRPICQNIYLRGDYLNLINEMRLQGREMFLSTMTAEEFDY